jgi:hypothetical protein
VFREMGGMGRQVGSRPGEEDGVGILDGAGRAVKSHSGPEGPQRMMWICSGSRATQRIPSLAGVFRTHPESSLACLEQSGLSDE